MSTGLSSRFSLSKGKFQLTGGEDKVKENIWFYCIFDKFRIYASDFGGNFVSLLQKPISYLQLNRTLIVGSLKRGIQKYVGNVVVKNIDIGYMSGNRKNYSILIEYASHDEDNNDINGVTFV